MPVHDGPHDLRIGGCLERGCLCQAEVFETQAEGLTTRTRRRPGNTDVDDRPRLEDRERRGVALRGTDELHP